MLQAVARLRLSYGDENGPNIKSNVNNDAHDAGEDRIVMLSSKPKAESPKESALNTMQAVKQMRDRENVLQSQIIKNLQEDHATIAKKLEETCNALLSAKQREASLENSISDLSCDNEELASSNESLIKENAEKQQTIEGLMEQMRLLKSQEGTDARILKAAKKYLKMVFNYGEAERASRPIQMSKAEWQVDARVAACGGCQRRFGTFLRRHHCRSCGQVFCSDCCSGTAVMYDSTGAPTPHMGHQRCCTACAKMVTEADGKKKHFKAMAKNGLREMEQVLASGEVLFDDLE